jgi:hypothetical protein
MRLKLLLVLLLSLISVDTILAQRPVVIDEVSAGSTDVQAVDPVTSRVRLCGFSFTETTGTDPASVVIHIGEDATGPVIANVTLSANESAREMFDCESGPNISSGIFINRTGSSPGTFYSQRY